jgi:hypothetical protein
LMKFTRAISRVKWLRGERTNVSKTISVLVLRVLLWLWFGMKTFCPNLYLAQSVYATGRWACSMAALPGSVSCLNNNFVTGFQSPAQCGTAVPVEVFGVESYLDCFLDEEIHVS